MKSLFVKTFFLICVLAVSICAQSNSWNGLTPLRSTRADVEKLLGGGGQSFGRAVHEYKIESGKVEILYAAHPCMDGWNVPKDTVLRIYVYSSVDRGKSAEELNLDESKFSIKVDDTFSELWINAENGLAYSFESASYYLTTKWFIPKKSDNETLRCDGFPPYQPENRYYTDFIYSFYPSSLSKKKGLEEAITQFDGLYIRLINSPKDEYKAYVLVYFDNRFSLAEYRTRVENIKKFIFTVRKFPPELITIIEGGLHDSATMEFYILRKDTPPLVPEPTLPSPQFMKGSTNKNK